MRVVYLDLDGTLLGPGGSVLAGDGGAPCDAGVRALLHLRALGVPVVLVSGRSRARLETSARLLGADGILPELGACDCGHPTAPGETVHDAIARTGIPVELLRREPDLEIHPAAQWGREGSHVFRGRARDGAAAWVADRSGGALRLADNGRLGDGGHVYHLLPAAASKGTAVATDIARRGAEPAACLAVGDSAEDAAMAAHVGAFALVRNGAEADADLASRMPWVTAGRYGAGVLEAVLEWSGSR